MGLFDKFTGRVADLIDDVLLSDEHRVLLVRAQKAMPSDPAETLRLCDAVIEARPDVARAWALKGQAALELGERDIALGALSRAARLKPTAATFGTLGRALEHFGDERAARDAYRRALDQNPDDPEAFAIHLGLARVQRSLGRWDKVAREIRKAFKRHVDPQRGGDYVEAQALMGQAQLQRGQAEEVVASLAEDATAQLEGDAPLDGPAAQLVAVYGRALFAVGDPGAGRVLAEAARRALGTDATLLLDAAAVLADAGDHTASASMLDRLPAELDRTMTARRDFLRGAVLTQKGDLSEGLRHLDRAAAVLTTDVGVQTTRAEATLGLAQSRQGEEATALWRLARTQWQEVRTLAPTQGRAWRGLGIVRWRGPEPDLAAARRLLSGAVARGDDEARGALASVFLELGEPAAAVSTLAGHERNESDRALVRRAAEELVSHLTIPKQDCRDLEQWRTGARTLRDELVRFADVDRGRDGSLQQQADELQKLLDTLDTPLAVAVVGEFNAGKSTLVNALLGEKVVPMGVLPTTAHVGELTWGPRREAVFHLRDGTEEIVELPDVRGRVKSDKGIGDVLYIEFRFPHPDLRRVSLWDTPGFNALDESHEAHARRGLADAEAVLWVCDAGQTLTESELAMISTVGAPSERLVVVINKIDHYEDRDAAATELIEHVRVGLDGEVRQIIAVSAKEGLTYAETCRNDPETELPDGNVPALHAFVETELFDRARTVKASNAALTVVAVCRNAAISLDDLAGLADRAVARLTALADSLSGRRDELADFARREEASVEDQIDFLVTLLDRELDEALRPSDKLLDALLTRMDLDSEDTEFLVELAQSRFRDILERSRGRMVAHLVEVESRIVNDVDALASGMPSRLSRQVDRHLAAMLAETEVLRRLLTERLYERYRHIAHGRSQGLETHKRIESAAKHEADDRARELRALLPTVAGTFTTVFAAWCEEYLSAVVRFCDLLRADLQVMLVELKALVERLHPQGPHTEPD